LNYDALWKTLDALLIEVRRKGSTVAQDVVDDLKSARTLINIYAADPTSTDTLAQIEDYLRRVESSLLFLAEADHGTAYAEAIMARLGTARTLGDDPAPPEVPRFIPGITPGQHWVRIDTRDTIDRAALTALAADMGLTLTMQGAHHAVIRGDKATVTRLLQRVTEQTRRTRGS
jgi:hypothetical protein